MPVNLQKVRSGDPLVIPAATFNAFVDVARDHQERQRSATKDGSPDWRQTGIVLVRNDSGADRARFDVLGVSGPVITPTDNADAFKERVAIKGVTPTTAHAGRFVVLLEPVKAGLTYADIAPFFDTQFAGVALTSWTFVAGPRVVHLPALRRAGGCGAEWGLSGARAITGGRPARAEP